MNKETLHEVLQILKFTAMLYEYYGTGKIVFINTIESVHDIRLAVGCDNLSINKRISSPQVLLKEVSDEACGFLVSKVFYIEDLIKSLKYSDISDIEMSIDGDAICLQSNDYDHNVVGFRIDMTGEESVSSVLEINQLISKYYNNSDLAKAVTHLDMSTVTYNDGKSCPQICISTINSQLCVSIRIPYAKIDSNSRFSIRDTSYQDHTFPIIIHHFDDMDIVHTIQASIIPYKICGSDTI